jgi:hypothetical protein
MSKHLRRKREGEREREREWEKEQGCQILHDKTKNGNTIY